MPTEIWCVEDDENIREIEVYTLRNTGFNARGFADAAEFFRALAEQGNSPSLVILDIMLPGEDGISILRKLRQAAATASLPVIMATAKGAEYDKVKGLDLGADDYLVKPFGMMEMVSRVRAVLRRAAVPAASKQLVYSGITIDIAAHTVKAGGQPVSLTLKEFALLHLLLSNPGRVFSRDELFKSVWNDEFCGESRTVDMHVRTLRQKLGDYGEIIETVRGIGYRVRNSECGVRS